MMTGMEFFEWYLITLKDYINLSKIFEMSLHELTKSFGPPGVSGKVIEIKSAVDRIIQICKELIAWEYDLQKISPPDGLLEVKRLMHGWSSIIIDHVNLLPKQTRNVLNTNDELNQEGSIVSINLTIRFPDSIETVSEIFKNHNYFES